MVGSVLAVVGTVQATVCDSVAGVVGSVFAVVRTVRETVCDSVARVIRSVLAVIGTNADTDYTLGKVRLGTEGLVTMTGVCRVMSVRTIVKDEAPAAIERALEIVSAVQAQLQV